MSRRGRRLPIASFYPIPIGVQQPFVSSANFRAKKLAIANPCLQSPFCSYALFIVMVSVIPHLKWKSRV